MSSLEVLSVATSNGPRTGEQGDGLARRERVDRGKHDGVRSRGATHRRWCWHQAQARADDPDPLSRRDGKSYEYPRGAARTGLEVPGRSGYTDGGLLATIVKGDPHPSGYAACEVIPRTQSPLA